VRLVVVVITVVPVMMLTRNRGPAAISWIRGRGWRYASLSPLLGPALVNGLNDGRLVEKNDPGLGVPGVSGIFEVPEVDVCHSLVRLSHNSDTDISVLLVLAVERVPHNIVAGLWV